MHTEKNGTRFATTIVTCVWYHDIRVTDPDSSVDSTVFMQMGTSSIIMDVSIGDEKLSIASNDERE